MTPPRLEAHGNSRDWPHPTGPTISRFPSPFPIRHLLKLLAEGIQAGPQWEGFVPVRTSNGVTIDYAEADDIGHQHCAFLVSDTEFDVALARIQSAGIEFYADYDRKGRGEIHQLYGGRGVYFYDPNSHLFELITRPYGDTPEKWSEVVERDRLKNH